jgi:hypothetical protein
MARQWLPREQAGGSGDVAAALAALEADELRAFIGGTRFPAYPGRPRPAGPTRMFASVDGSAVMVDIVERMPTEMPPATARTAGSARVVAPKAPAARGFRLLLDASADTTNISHPRT